MSARVASLACTSVLISLSMVAVGWGPLSEVAAQASYFLLVIALLIALVSSVASGWRRRGSVDACPPVPRNPPLDSSSERGAQ